LYGCEDLEVKEERDRPDEDNFFLSYYKYFTINYLIYQHLC
jgi:hypothetical protein